DDIDDDNDDVDGGANGVMLSTFGGKIKISTRVHDMYLHRCAADDIDHPYHGMCYVVWLRLVRTEKAAPTSSKKSRDDGHDEESESDEDNDFDDKNGGDDCTDGI
ncbi:unnamed protein product, partial [Pylaiella littoralis]